MVHLLSRRWYDDKQALFLLSIICCIIIEAKVKMFYLNLALSYQYEDYYQPRDIQWEKRFATYILLSP